ncbi:hypothetical protein Dimus_010463 [Dionaea muscipula]
MPTSSSTVARGGGQRRDPSDGSEIRVRRLRFRRFGARFERVVNLTLIDLPGLTKVAVEGQPDCIVQDIENMVRSYVEKVTESCGLFPFSQFLRFLVIFSYV